MKYAELDDRAKARAFDKWRENEPHDEWWDYTYADAVTVGALMGIEIGSSQVRTAKGFNYDKIDISFSGFCSQGDGACFSGQLRVAHMAGAVEKMKGYASQDEELHRLAAVAEDIHAQIAAALAADRLSDEDPEHPECSLTMSVAINGKERTFSTSVDGDYLPNATEAECDGFVSDFAAWIYDQLEAEHDHLTSEESFLAWVDSDDPDYDEDGNPE